MFTEAFKTLWIIELPEGDFKKHEPVRYADLRRYVEILNVILKMNGILGDIWGLETSRTTRLKYRDLLMQTFLGVKGLF